MVEVRRFGARFNLLRNSIHGRRPQQQRSPQLSLMHQDIRWVFLVHDICLFFFCSTLASPPPSPTFTQGHSPSTTIHRAMSQYAGAA